MKPNRSTALIVADALVQCVQCVFKAGESVYRDAVNGCEYVVSATAQSITPRLAPDGSHMGCKGG